MAALRQSRNTSHIAAKSGRIEERHHIFSRSVCIAREQSQRRPWWEMVAAALTDFDVSSVGRVESQISVIMHGALQHRRRRRPKSISILASCWTSAHSVVNLTAVRQTPRCPAPTCRINLSSLGFNDWPPFGWTVRLFNLKSITLEQRNCHVKRRRLQAAACRTSGCSPWRRCGPFARLLHSNSSSRPITRTGGRLMVLPSKRLRLAHFPSSKPRIESFGLCWELCCGVCPWPYR